MCDHAHLSKLFDSKIVYCKDKCALKRLDEIRRKAAENLEENVEVFNQALNKYLAEYEKVGICPRHFESMTEFIESYNKEISEEI